MKIEKLVAAFDKQRMKLNQPKYEQPFLHSEGLLISTLHNKNKITGWRVNQKEFPVKGRTILETWKAVEKYVNQILKNKK